MLTLRDAIDKAAVGRLIAYNTFEDSAFWQVFNYTINRVILPQEILATQDELSELMAEVPFHGDASLEQRPVVKVVLDEKSRQIRFKMRVLEKDTSGPKTWSENYHVRDRFVENLDNAFSHLA